MKKLGLFFGLIFLSDVSFSQRWTEMMSESGSNFYEIQKEFYDYFKDKNKDEKGNGYKQFKRWEWYNSTRLGDGGSRIKCKGLD